MTDGVKLTRQDKICRALSVCVVITGGHGRPDEKQRPLFQSGAGGSFQALRPDPDRRPDNQELKKFYVTQDEGILNPILGKIKYVQDCLRNEFEPAK